MMGSGKAPCGLPFTNRIQAANIYNRKQLTSWCSRCISVSGTEKNKPMASCPMRSKSISFWAFTCWIPAPWSRKSLLENSVSAQPTRSLLLAIWLTAEMTILRAS